MTVSLPRAAGGEPPHPGPLPLAGLPLPGRLHRLGGGTGATQPAGRARRFEHHSHGGATVGAATPRQHWPQGGLQACTGGMLRCAFGCSGSEALLRMPDDAGHEKAGRTRRRLTVLPMQKPCSRLWSSSGWRSGSSGGAATARSSGGEGGVVKQTCVCTTPLLFCFCLLCFVQHCLSFCCVCPSNPLNAHAPYATCLFHVFACLRRLHVTDKRRCKQI